MLEYQNIKTILQNSMFEIGEHVKTLCCGHMSLVILMEKKLLENFTKKNCEKHEKEFRVEKLIKRKGDKLC